MKKFLSLMLAISLSLPNFAVDTYALNSNFENDNIISGAALDFDSTENDELSSGSSLRLFSATTANKDFPSSFYLTQTPKRCTLCACAMMLRSKLFQGGVSNWSAVTEDYIYSAAWAKFGSLGYSWSCSVDGSTINVNHTSVSGLTIAQLKSILDSHPEGIVIYERAIPHAILVYDYVGDTFYCADPASGYSGRKITLVESGLKNSGNKTQGAILSGIDDYWYVSSSNIIISRDSKGPVVSNANYSDISGGFYARMDVNDDSQVSEITLEVWTDGLGRNNSVKYTKYPATKSGTVGFTVYRENLQNATGAYHLAVTAKDTLGNISSYTLPDKYVNPDEKPPSISDISIQIIENNGAFAIGYSLGDNNGLAYYDFGVWTTDDQSDIQWYHSDIGNMFGNRPTLYVGGSYTVRRSKFGDKYGYYHSCIIIADVSGNKTTHIFDDVYFAPPQYSVKYISDSDVKNMPQNETLDLNTNYYVSSTIPSKEGYDFMYWVRTDTNKQVYPGTLLGSLTDNITLEAVWQEKPKEIDESKYAIIVEADNVTVNKTANTFTLPIKISNNIGICSLGFDVEYDADIMTLVSVENGNVFDVSDLTLGDYSQNPYTVSYSRLTDIKNDGDLIKFNFKLKDNIVAGKYPIKLSTGRFGGALNINEEEAIVVYNNSVIDITDSVAGDINGDGKLSRADLTRLNKYFAGWDVEINESAADVNADGKLSRADLTRLNKYFAGWDVSIG